MSINPALYGPLGTIVVAAVSGLLLLWANKINKKVTPQDLTKLGVDILEKATARADKEREASDEKYAKCEAGLKVANDKLNRRDHATFDLLDKQSALEATLSRQVEVLERVALQWMTPEQAAAYRVDQDIVKQQRVDAHAASRALKKIILAA